MDDDNDDTDGGTDIYYNNDDANMGHLLVWMMKMTILTVVMILTIIMTMPTWATF